MHAGQISVSTGPYFPYNGAVLTLDEETSIRTFFHPRPEVVAVFLFGSRARQKERPESDVDLAVLLDPSVPEQDYLSKRLQWMEALSQGLSQEPDVVILNEAGPVLLHQILRYGKLLYEKSRLTTTTFKAYAMMAYVDWLPYKERLDQAVLKHFRPGHG